MHAARKGVLVAAVLALAVETSAAPAPGMPVGAPPRILNIVRARLKPNTAGPYGVLESQIVRAYDRARAKVYWIGLQSTKDQHEVLYLNLFDSQAAADRMTAAYRELVKQHPEVLQLQQRLSAMTASESSTLTTRRDDIDREPRGVDFATMRTLRLTLFQVRPGREGEFLNAIRTASPKDGSWLVYEANDTSTYALITLKRAQFSRRDGSPFPKTLRRHKGVYLKADTHVYAVRPGWSHLSQAFAAATH